MAKEIGFAQSNLLFPEVELVTIWLPKVTIWVTFF